MPIFYNMTGYNFKIHAIEIVFQGQEVHEFKEYQAI